MSNSMNKNDQQSARDEVQVLTFSLESVFYGVDVHQVREVKNFEGVTPVPYAPEYVKGVTNLRGEIVPVIDMRKLFGVAGLKAIEGAGIMVIIQGDHPIGVMVDSVNDVLTISKKDIEPTPESLTTNRSEAMLGIAKHENSLIMMLDLRRIVSKNGLENLKKSPKGFEISKETAQPNIT
jgi:purine-binding chemotaxis protein CheW